MNFDREKIDRVKAQYPVGARIELIGMCNDEPGMEPGLCGTVVGVDDQPALLMRWDNGRSLSLFPDKDSFRVIEQEETMELRQGM